MTSNYQEYFFTITAIDFVHVGQLPNLQNPMIVTAFVGSLEMKLGKNWLSYTDPD